jgi:hypothetical protein
MRLEEQMRRAFAAMLCAMICHLGSAAEVQRSKVWDDLKKRAEASEDPKALWRELKKLSPEELLLCGKQLCVDARKQSEKADAETVILPVNAILSYHTDKTSYEQTAQAVGQIIENSSTASWVYGAMEWVENNDHYKHIPRSGMLAIGQGMLKSLRNDKRPGDVQEVVLRKVASYDILANIPKETRDLILAGTRAMAAEGDNTALQQRARSSLSSVERWIAEVEQHD